MTGQPQLPSHVQAMLDPSFYLEKPRSIELLQTQMSFVLIAGGFVYKIKKPVNLGYLDYSTIDKREYYCRRELELNKRLCPGAYLDVVTISRSGNEFVLGNGDEIVDFAVKMRNLPQNRMLSILLQRNEVSLEAMERIARRVADFHARAETNAIISDFGSIASIRTNTEENFEQTREAVGRTLSQTKYQRIMEYTRQFVTGNAAIFEGRVNGGRIRDCHGDMHAAHVCITDGICIYDCIEFNERFRYGDVASEIAFLAMDLDHYGRGDLSSCLVDSYVRESDDRDMMKLVPFYKCYRAYVRGKVEGFKLKDAYLSQKEKDSAVETAAGYFDLAGFYARPRPALFVTVGVTGTGKSTMSYALARHTGAIVLSSDVIRKGLADIPVTEHRFDVFGSGIYTQEFSRRTYDRMFALAADYLASGRSVVLDATFIRKADRVRAADVAIRHDADLLVMECRLSDESIRQWLARRSRTGSASDGREEILEPQMRAFEPVDELPERQYISLDMAQPVGRRIEQVLNRLGET
jgi:uncharacterized protein